MVEDLFCLIKEAKTIHNHTLNIDTKSKAYEENDGKVVIFIKETTTVQCEKYDNIYIKTPQHSMVIYLKHHNIPW